MRADALQLGRGLDGHRLAKARRDGARLLDDFNDGGRIADANDLAGLAGILDYVTGSESERMCHKKWGYGAGFPAPCHIKL